MIDRACFSLTQRCNLRCRYCHFSDKRDDGTPLAVEDALTVVDNIWRYATESGLKRFKFGIVGAGEPLLELDTILAMLQHIESLDGRGVFQLYLITNGTLASTEALERLAPYRELLGVCFSLDGPREIHEAGRASFTEAMKGIDNYKSVYGAAPSVNATVSLKTIQHAEDVITFFKNQGISKVTFSRLVACDDEDLAIDTEQFARFIGQARASGLSSRQFRSEKSYDCTMYGRLCGVGRTNPLFTAEGVYPCGRFYKNDAYLLGSIGDPLSDIERRMKAMAPVKDGTCYYEEVAGDEDRDLRRACER